MKVIKTAQRMGIAVRIEGSSATVQKYKDLGVKHFCTGARAHAALYVYPMLPVRLPGCVSMCAH